MLHGSISVIYYALAIVTGVFCCVLEVLFRCTSIIVGTCNPVDHLILRSVLFQICTMLLCLLFVYDIFFVFISPYFMPVSIGLSPDACFLIQCDDLYVVYIYIVYIIVYSGGVLKVLCRLREGRVS